MRIEKRPSLCKGDFRMAPKPIHVSQGELTYPAPNGCTIVSAPVKGGYSAPVKEFVQIIETEDGPRTEKISTPVVECDGWNHRVFDADGELIGEAPTLGKARAIARTGGPVAENEPTQPEGQAGGKRKGRK